MPLKAQDYPVSVGLRISVEQAAKLDALAAMTGLPRNALLRHLIARAKPSAFPDIVLDRGAPRGAEALGPVKIRVDRRGVAAEE
jgi:hypothetical protein